MDPLITVLIIVISLLTLLLIVVGIQVFFILKELRGTLKHLNHTLETTDSVIAYVARSFSSMGDSLAGVKAGLKMLEGFVSWIKKHEPDHKSIHG
jgi:hypothetical protein